MAIHHDVCFDHLEADLRRMAEVGRLVYIANPGNWGDALIAEGTRKFFRDREIEVTEIDLFSARSWGSLRLRYATRSLKPIMVFGGGGAFVNYYKRKEQIESIARKFYGSIIMPSTFAVSLNRDLFKLRSIIYRRDVYQSQDFAPESKFCHDMAFNLTPPPVNLVNSDGYFFREDIESPEEVVLPKNNRDLSGEGTATKSIDDFFKIVGSFSVIYTNRLHVAIAASMLNREVHFFPNSYFKNEAVYKSSLKPFFPNTHFHETTPQAFGLC